MKIISDAIKLLLVMILMVSCQSNLIGTFIKPDPNTDLPGKSFVSIWRTSQYDEVVQLPLRSGFNYDMIVNWGDDSENSHITSWDDPFSAHTYDVPGDYTITISGLAEAWNFNGALIASKLIEVKEFGGLGWINLEGAFFGCGNLVKFSGGDISKVTSIADIFRGAGRLVDLNIGNWNTSNVTDMRGLFRASPANPDFSKWDTSKVTDMSYMFYYNTGATGDLSKWNTSSVVNMGFMFRDSVMDPDVSNWDIQNVKYLTQTFLRIIGNPDVSKWNTSNVIEMGNIFQQSPNANPDVSNWDFSKTTNLNFIFSSATSLSTENYSKFLIRLEATSPLVGSRSLVVSAKYNASATPARESLVFRGWRLTDSGLE